MFGDDTFGPAIRVCCGPRCGVEPNHRAVYEAAEQATASACAAVLPTMCRGLCGHGVTLVRPDGQKIKARDADEARAQLTGGI